MHLLQLSEPSLLGYLWCVWMQHSWNDLSLHRPSQPGWISLLFAGWRTVTSRPPLRPPFCFRFRRRIPLRLYERAVAAESSHPRPALRKSTGAAQIVSTSHQQSNRSQNKKGEKKEREKEREIFCAFCRIWGRNLITTAGVCRHWQKKKKNNKKKNTRRQMNIQSKWQNMRGNNWQMKRQRMCS